MRTLLISSFAIACLAHLSLAADPEPLQLGEKLPAFKLPGVDGKTYTDADFAEAKLLLLVFTCNHCPTAQAYEDRIKQLDAAYRGKGVKLVAISPNDDKAVRLDELGYTDLNDSLAEMKIRAKQRGFEFPYLYDGETQEFSRKLGVAATPQVYIFDADRKLRYTGRIDDGEVTEVKSHDARNALDDLLAGREAKVSKTRTFGCSTKWAEKRDGAAKADEAWAKQEVKLARAGDDAIAKLLKDQGDDYLLINLWASWCGPCVTEFPELVRIQRMYGRRPFKLITISLDGEDDEAQVIKFLKEKQAAQMTNLLFTGDKDKLANLINPRWPGPIPHTVLLAPGGKIVFKKTGAFDALELRGVIADQLGRTYACRKK